MAAVTSYERLNFQFAYPPQYTLFAPKFDITFVFHFPQVSQNCQYYRTRNCLKFDISKTKRTVCMEKFEIPRIFFFGGGGEGWTGCIMGEVIMANRRKLGAQGKTRPSDTTQFYSNLSVQHHFLLQPKSFVWTYFDTRQEGSLTSQFKKEEHALEFASFSDLFCGKTSYFTSKNPV